MPSIFDTLRLLHLYEASFKQFREIGSKMGVPHDELFAAYKLWKNISDKKSKDALNFNNYLSNPQEFVGDVKLYTKSRQITPLKDRTSRILENDKALLVSPANAQAAIKAARTYKAFGCEPVSKDYLPTWCIAATDAHKFWKEYLLEDEKYRMVFYVLIKHPSVPEKSRYAIVLDVEAMPRFVQGKIPFSRAILEVQDPEQRMFRMEGINNQSNLKDLMRESGFSLKELRRLYKVICSKTHKQPQGIHRPPRF